MPVAWPIVRFLFKWVAPSIPEIISTVSNLREQREQTTMQEEDFDKRFLEIERNLTIQLKVINNLTRQIDSLNVIIRRTLIISILALCLGLLVLGLIFFTPSLNT